MARVKVWQEPVTFKTYKTGAQDQHPIFLEHRVYQGSSGAVYPYGVTDTLLDQTEDKVYQALYLENDYLKIMILPELGGRVHRAYDKVNQRDFVYFNHVVKPALVGLLGPWISGGIEFNTPQHHRPTTFMGVDANIQENADGSATVYVGEREPMHGLTITTGFTLFPDKALLQISSRIYNGNDTPRSFLWWANPAVKGGDGHQSVFPPDVTAVFDHGKRAVIDFPIAHGEYYKVKYDGADISRYKNLPVPTSYMAWRSDYDFVGAYCHDEEGGLLHVADHHVSPGKKQWTWGYGDFGQAWDRNLTDEDGPYIELMTGVYTDNQPDFTWLEPGESKEFVQNFLPYSKLGTVQNANTRAAIKLERCDGKLHVGVYAIEALQGQAVISDEKGNELYREAVELTPCHAKMWELPDNCAERLAMRLEDAAGKTIVSYLEHIAQPVPLPEVAKAPAFPKDIQSADEAFFIGQHLEQYHHATRSNYEYYERGLEIDPLDYRCNVAMGNYEFNRCNYTKALEYAENALKRAHMLNRNSSCGLGSVLKGNCLFKLNRLDEAYDEFFRATWSYNGRTKGYIGLGEICALKQDFAQASYFAQRALQTETTNQEALALQAYAAIMSHSSEAADFIEQGLKVCPLNPLLQFLKSLHSKMQAGGACSQQDYQNVAKALNQREINYLTIAEFLLKVGRKDICVELFKCCPPVGAIANLVYASLVEDQNERAAILIAAQNAFKTWVRFPNFTFERDLLGSLTDNAFALHMCASFDYSHRLYERAADLWQHCLKLEPEFVEAWRGLGIYQFNKLHDQLAALKSFASALEYSHGDERILFENDLLLKLTHHTPQQRLAVLNKYDLTNCLRDDLKAELVTLYNQAGEIDKAHAMLEQRVFHVWEGGEGRVTGQFINNAILRAHKTAAQGDYAQALEIIKSALTFPYNLGEGKLVVQTDNDLYFFAAYYAAQAGLSAESAEFLQKAMVGDTAIAEQHYYNDLPCDYVFYNALAQKIAGKSQEAEQIFTTMRTWSYEAFNEVVHEDFFAVSLPDLVVLDRSLNEARQENCLLMRLLASIGLNDRALFTKTIADFKQLQPSNFKIALYETLADSLFKAAEQGKF